MNNTEYIPDCLKRWETPQYYMGAEWPEWYVFLVQHRDSNALERANFAAGLRAVGGESDTVYVIRASHWAVGWVEWIGIHESNTEALRVANDIARGLLDYPVVCDETFSEYEEDEALETWQYSYDVAERIQYIRDHRNQFEFHDYASLRACIRGEYFGGYASELIG